MNNTIFVNTGSGRALAEKTLLARLEAILTEFGWGAHLVVEDEPGGFDARVRMGSLFGPPVELLVECKWGISPAGFASLARSRESLARSLGGTPVLGVEVASERLAMACQQAGWGWFDSMGNCVIDVPMILHVERRGRERPGKVPRPRANLGTAAAGRVLRALLTPAHAGRTWTQRSIQDATRLAITGDKPVSLGLVNKVLRHLGEEGYISHSSGRGIELRDASGLLDAWTAAYRFDRDERLAYFTLRSEREIAASVGCRASGEATLAVFAAYSAAERQAPQVRQGRIWLRVAASRLGSFVQEIDAKEVESGENVIVLVPDDLGSMVDYSDPPAALDPTRACTDPVQTYVDLVHCGGRGEEAARALLEQRLRPAWANAGVR